VTQKINAEEDPSAATTTTTTTTATRTTRDRSVYDGAKTFPAAIGAQKKLRRWTQFTTTPQSRENPSEKKEKKRAHTHARPRAHII
jgi:hypothetical protein